MESIYNIMKTKHQNGFWRGFGSVIVLRPNTISKIKKLQSQRPAKVDDFDAIGQDFATVGVDIEKAKLMLEELESKR